MNHDCIEVWGFKTSELLHHPNSCAQPNQLTQHKEDSKPSHFGFIESLSASQSRAEPVGHEREGDRTHREKGEPTTAVEQLVSSTDSGERAHVRSLEPPFPALAERGNLMLAMPLGTNNPARLSKGDKDNAQPNRSLIWYDLRSMQIKSMDFCAGDPAFGGLRGFTPASKLLIEIRRLRTS
ncbi:uncharacterized protein PAC_09146 [Phialocephala subalpina]|uniref:Uncharacterized protein n=1 Tax=Phialocephala subalpina TaxID=576137 RepID=A0A1L7X2L4_9HELO|nr:uncharacterized protein PAC_09146 [Phialocephala subalpina]